MKKRLTRAEVLPKLTWKLADLFATPKEWEQELENVLADIPGITQYKGRLGESAGILLECLEFEEALYERAMRVGTYAHLRLAEDGTNPENQANLGRATSMSAKLGAACSFVESEILDLSTDKVHQYFAEEPKLESLRKPVQDILEKKPYRLSLETELALASLSEVHRAPYTIYQQSKSSDMQFAPISDDENNELPMSFALYEGRYESDPDNQLRREAYHSFVETLKQYQNTFAATYNTEVKKQVVISELRNYQSATDMLLQPQQVTEEMYNNLLDIIQAELAPHMRRFATLKKEMLGLDELLFCDLKAPLDPNYNPSLTFEEASELIIDALKVLGSEYRQIMEQALAGRWVDLADNVGKSTGAFCASPYGSHPFLLVTWADSMRSAFTLAHELGHAGHFYLANKYQRMANTRPSRYFVEAPSTMNELLLGQYLLAKHEEPKMRRFVILQLLGTYYHNYVTHLLEGELQRRVYQHAGQGKSLTAATLNQFKGEVLQDFWGETVTIDEGAKLTWMRQPHYYMGLYPYTYSAGLTVSTACAQLIKEEGQPAVNRWIEVLKAGGTQRPLELIKRAGLDMSNPQPIRKAVAYVGTLVDELVESFSQGK